MVLLNLLLASSQFLLPLIERNLTLLEPVLALLDFLISLLNLFFELTFLVQELLLYFKEFFLFDDLCLIISGLYHLFIFSGNDISEKYVADNSSY